MIAYQTIERKSDYFVVISKNVEDCFLVVLILTAQSSERRPFRILNLQVNVKKLSSKSNKFIQTLFNNFDLKILAT